MLRWTISIVTIIIVGSGCAPTQTILLDPMHVPRGKPDSYSDADLAVVLQNNVERGQVRYASLKQSREPLERYLGQISVVGPKLTPELFPQPSDRICYYANAFNACALRAALDQYPTTTVYNINLSFLHGNRFRVDGRQVTLGRMREMMLAESDGDARLLFCLSAAAVGSPRLANAPLRPAGLEDRRQEAMRDGLNNTQLVRVDSAARTIYLWDQLVSRSADFVAVHIRKGGRQNANLIEALAALAGGDAQRRLLEARGYRVLRMPFDRRLNDLPTPPAVTTTASSN